MKFLQFLKYCAFLFLFNWTSLFVQAQTSVFQFEGLYQGDNVFIQNPLSDSVGNYCTITIDVNKIKMLAGFDMSAYEIRLDTLNLKLGDPVNVSIFHWSDCKPRILTSIITPRPTYEIKEITIDSTGLLKWSTVKEDAKLTYIIEQFIWNKWISIGEVKGNGKPLLNDYEFKVPLHSGTNKFRVKQTNGGKAIFSNHVSIQCNDEKARLLKHAVIDKIEFSRAVRFEIYDASGNKKGSGLADKVDVSDFPKGNYFLNYDNVTTEFIKQ